MSATRERDRPDRPEPEDDPPQAQIRIAGAPTRCPYCHDEVDKDRDEWAACESCLTRHHADCWSESGRCASCAHDVSLSNSDRDAPAPRSRRRSTLERHPSGDYERHAHSWLAGGPTRLLYRRCFQGELDLEREVSWFGSALRRLSKAQGEVNYRPGKLTWRAFPPVQHNNGCAGQGLTVTLQVKDGQTTLTVSQALNQQLGGIYGGIGGGLGGGLVGGGALAPAALIPLLAVILVAVAWLARWVYAFTALRARDHMRGIVDVLTEDLAREPAPGAKAKS